MFGSGTLEKVFLLEHREVPLIINLTLTVKFSIILIHLRLKRDIPLTFYLGGRAFFILRCSVTFILKLGFMQSWWHRDMLIDHVGIEAFDVE